MAQGGAGPAGDSADAARRDLELLRLRLERELLRTLARLDTERDSPQLVSDRDAARTAASVYRQVERALQDQGVATIRSIVAQRALEAIEAVAPGEAWPPDVRRELDAIVRGQVADVVKVFDVAADEVRRAVNAGVTTGGNLGDLVAEVGDRMNVAFFRATAAVDSSIMAVGRRAVVSAAEAQAKEAGVDVVYAYVGPTDAKNRPFCAVWMGRADGVRKAVTAEYMRTLDNGQGLDVGDFCGGYNCRHSWAPIPRERAIARGFKVFG
jgi:hypothetical protein